MRLSEVQWVLGTRYQVSGTGYQIPGTRYGYLVPGTGYQVPGTRYRVPGTRYWELLLKFSPGDLPQTVLLQANFMGVESDFTLMAEEPPPGHPWSV